MASVVLPSRGRGYRLYLDLAQVSQNIANNTSTVSWNLYIVRGSGSGAFSGYRSFWSAAGSSGEIASYDFRNYSTLGLGSGTFVVNHNANGTGTATASGSFSEADPDPELGSGTVSASLTLTTIPRATQPTVSPSSGFTGSSFTIGHVPATNTFFHDIAYSIDNGNTFTNIQVNIPGTDTSTDWTPPHTLLPNTTNLTAVIRAITRATAGGTIIGTRTVNLPLTVPSSVRPSVSAVSWTDAQTSSPDIPTMMGGADRFVQGWTRLVPSVTATGSGGSIVVGTSVSQGGQITSSGVAFTNPVNLSGAVPFSATATDSRGVVSPAYANTVPVTAYNFPNLPTPLIARTSDAAGLFPSPTGTYFAITPAASVSSLIFGGAQKNLLEWRIRVKELGGSYVTVHDWNSSTVSGNTWTSKIVIGGGYAASSEYVVEVSIRDLFGKSGFNVGSTVRTLEVGVRSEEVFMDYDGNEGMGLGGYRRYGKLDVHGDVYAENAYVEGAVSAATVTADSISQGGNAVIVETDARLTNARTPLPHTLDSHTGVLALSKGGTGINAASLNALKTSLGIPYAMAAGIATSPGGGGNQSSIIYWDAGQTITFPVGRFNRAPIVTATVDTNTTGGVSAGAGVIVTTATSFILRLNRVGGSPGGFTGHWQAVQMTSASSAG